MTKLLEGRIAYFEASKIGRPFGHQHEKPSFVYEAIPETDPLIQTVLLHEGLKKLNATEPFVVPEEVVRLGVEARGIPRGSTEFDTQFAIACVDLAKRHGGVCRVAPTIQPDTEAGRLEAVPELKQARWEDIEFVIDDHTIEVHLAGKSETVGFEDFGFQDKRTGKPNQQWAVLQVLARCRGGVMPDDARQGTEWMAIAKRVERVRKTLQKRFGLHDDPMPFEEGTGYRARFKISRAPDPPEAHG